MRETHHGISPNQAQKLFLGSITGCLPMGNGVGAIGYRGIWLWQLVIYQWLVAIAMAIGYMGISYIIIGSMDISYMAIGYGYMAMFVDYMDVVRFDFLGFGLRTSFI